MDVEEMLRRVATSPVVYRLLMVGAEQAVKDSVSRFTVAKQKPDRVLQDRIAEGIAQHLQTVSNVVGSVQIAGMSSPIDTAKATIALAFDGLPRRYKLSGSEVESEFSEGDLLASSEDVLILGDPGAGKTTSVHRAILAVLNDESVGEGDDWQLPLLVSCRDHDWSSHTLVEVVSDLVGIPRELPSTINTRRDVLLTSVLDNAPAIIFIDGLDEVPLASKAGLEAQVVALANSFAKARVVTTCRSGAATFLKGFRTLEICPLDADQISQIADSYLGDGTDFCGALAASPLEELAGRPLFLTQLLTIWKNRGKSLPDQASSVYRDIVRLAIREWDEQRGLARTSAYGRFQVDEKQEFLAALSFSLTVELQSIRFDGPTLENVYLDLCEQFDLPTGEASKVARELEAHTGLIVQVGDAFEFSHLSLQEFLCADYMVRQPLGSDAARYLDEYPEPVAIAIALSSQPSDWMANLVLQRTVDPDESSVNRFISRLAKEVPKFRQDRRLGFAMLKLMAKGRWTLGAEYPRLAFRAVVRNSVKEAIGFYDLKETPRGMQLTWKKEQKAEPAPRAIEIDEDMFRLFAIGDDIVAISWRLGENDTVISFQTQAEFDAEREASDAALAEMREPEADV